MSSENKNNDLSFVSTDDLLKELNKRHDASIFTGIRFTDKNGEYSVCRNWRGHAMVVQGLASQMVYLLANESIKHTVETTENMDR